MYNLDVNTAIRDAINEVDDYRYEDREVDEYEKSCEEGYNKLLREYNHEDYTGNY